MSKRSKATDISIKTRQLVYERDNGLCIICGRPGIPNSHYIRRSKGGLGIPQNIVTMCISCHNAYDNGNRREEIATKTRNYLKSKYEEWDETKLIYDKWREYGIYQIYT